MHPRSILAIARKDALDLLLNKSSLVALFMPIMIALLFLFISKVLGGHTTPILVYNPDHSNLVQILSKNFDQPQIIQANAPTDVSSAFGPDGSQSETKYDVGLIIPANFEQSLQAGDHLQVILYTNGNNINRQNTLALETTILNYARATASPQPPVNIVAATVNPAPTSKVGQLLGTYYAATSLIVSLLVGVSLVPGLLIEEKEKKTLRMLMVTPASFTDVILGKLLVVLGYQVLLSLIVLAIQGGFIGQVPQILLYMLLGACFSLGLGLLFGTLFQTTSAAGAVGGIASLIFIIPGIFVGPVGQLMGNTAVSTILKLLPTYYIADGVYNAMQMQGSFSAQFLDIGVILGSTLILLLATSWLLRRQASVAAAV